MPDSENRAQGYEGVGPFQMKSGENPAAYIERTIGVGTTSVIILSRALGGGPVPSPSGYKPRVSPIYKWNLCEFSSAD